MPAFLWKSGVLRLFLISALPFLLPPSTLPFLSFFPPCSPPHHQGKSSPGAEIQFRSSSSAFSALTSLDGERTLSYLLPGLRLSDWEQVLPPCFHAVLSGRYSTVLRPVIWAYRGAEAPHSEPKIIKVVYSLGGKSKLASSMRYIHSASAKWSLRPGITGRWLPLWRFLFCFYL